MDRKKLLKIFSIITAALILGYTISAIYTAVVNNYKTQTAYIQTVSESTDAEMFIIRSETILENPDSETIVVPLAENGGRISNGCEIAAIFTDETSAENYSSLISLKNKLATYEKIDSGIRLANLDLEKLSGEINSDFYSMLDAVYENDFSSLAETELSFDEKLSRKNISLGKDVDCSETIASLAKEIEALSSSKPKKLIYAESSGYYVSRPDGYEDVIKIEDIDSLTPEILEEALNKEKNEISSNTIGKVINGHEWYIATCVSSSAVSTLAVGKTVEIVLGDDSDEVVSAKVYTNKLIEEGKSLMVFKCSNMNEKLATIRKVNGRIVTGSYRGIKIKKDAVRFNDEGEEGVYIKEGNLIYFNLIDVIYSDENYVVSNDGSGKAGHLSKYDEIVLSGKELSNGKVLD